LFVLKYVKFNKTWNCPLGTYYNLWLQPGIEGDEVAGRSSKKVLLKFECKTPFDQHTTVTMNSCRLAGSQDFL
jgi:hypothetical protein